MSSIEPPLRVDEKLQRTVLPELTSNAIPKLGRNDCLVFCSGFEARSLAVLERAIHSKKNDTFGAVRVDYLPEYRENQREHSTQLCVEAGLTVREVSYNRESPAGAGSLISDAISHYERVFIDISGMSRLLIVQILVALGQRGRGFDGVSIFYTEAQTYPPSQQEFSEECERAAGSDSVIIDSFISTGVFEIAITPELSSVAMHGEAIRLVAFPSFNRTQLHALISEIQPTFINLVDGMPPLEENKWRPQAIRNCNEKTIRSIANREEIMLSTLDYRETLRFLLGIYNERSAFDRLVIAPTGSKMQAVSIGLFRAFMNDVQIVYPTPQIFRAPERHTEGVRDIYHLALDVFAKVV